MIYFFYLCPPLRDVVANVRVLLRRRYPTIASLCAPITTTKGEGYYVKFFYTCLPLGVGVKNVKGIKRVE